MLQHVLSLRGAWRYRNRRCICCLKPSMGKKLTHLCLMSTRVLENAWILSYGLLCLSRKAGPVCRKAWLIPYLTIPKSQIRKKKPSHHMVKPLCSIRANTMSCKSIRRRSSLCMISFMEINSNSFTLVQMLFSPWTLFIHLNFVHAPP